MRWLRRWRWVTIDTYTVDCKHDGVVVCTARVVVQRRGDRHRMRMTR